MLQCFSTFVGTFVQRSFNTRSTFVQHHLFISFIAIRVANRVAMIPFNVRLTLVATETFLLSIFDNFI